jgi:hypothetical protein
VKLSGDVAPTFITVPLPVSGAPSWSVPVPQLVPPFAALQ